MAIVRDLLVGLIGSTLWLAIAAPVALAWYRMRYLRGLAEKLRDAFRWYGQLVHTIEWRLCRLSAAAAKHSEKDVERALIWLGADVEAAMYANDQLRSSLDLPLRPMKVQRQLVEFATTSTRLYSELARAVALARVEGGTNATTSHESRRYLCYLLGTRRSPITGGSKGKSVDDNADQLRTLLTSHQKAMAALAASVPIGTAGEVQQLLSPESTWIDWKAWEPRGDNEVVRS